MATLIRLVSLSMGIHLCCLRSLALLQVWLYSRTSKSISLGDVLAPIKRDFMRQHVELMYGITMYSPCLLT
jgi:hypothetical protein